VEEALSEGVQLLVQQGYIKSGDRIILTMGQNTGNEGGTNTLRLVEVGSGGYSEIQPSLDIA
jgi:pyruvate kinase